MKPEEATDIMRDLWCFQKSERYSDKQIREALVLAIEALKRPHGKWKLRSPYEAWFEEYKCSNCNAYGWLYWHFCPNCGADMREGDWNE